MKILHIHDYPPFEGGGVEINVSRTSEIMAEMGHSVTIATSRLESETTGKVSEKESKVNVALLDNTDQMYRLIDENEVVHIHMTFSLRPATFLAMEYCHDISKPCLVSVRTSPAHIPFSALSAIPPIERDYKLKKLRKFLMSEKVVISSPASFISEYLKDMGITKEVHVIRNGVSIEEPDADLEPSPVDFTYIGEISILKGVNTLIDCAMHLVNLKKDLKIRLIGGGSEFDFMKKLTKLYGLENNIEFVGYVNHRNISRYLEATGALVHPTLTDVWPNAVAEALYQGKNVFASNIEGLKEMLDLGKYGELYTPGSHNLYNLLARYLTDPQYRGEVSQKAKLAKELFTNEYTLENQVRNLINLYNNLDERK